MCGVWCVAGSNPNPLGGFKCLLEPRFPSLPCRPIWIVLFSDFVFLFFARPNTCICFHSDLKPAWISASNQSVKTHLSPRRLRQLRQTLQAARLFLCRHTLLREHLQGGQREGDAWVKMGLSDCRPSVLLFRYEKYIHIYTNIHAW